MARRKVQGTIGHCLIPGKVMEQSFLGIISKCMEDKKVTGSSEYGFTRGISCLTILVAFDSELTGFVDEQRGICCLF